MSTEYHIDRKSVSGFISLRALRRSLLWPLLRAPARLLAAGLLAREAPWIRVRGAAPPADPRELERRYRESPLAAEPDSFVLYRIIGNDIVPRHAPGQSAANLRFILDNEPSLPGCEKRWIVNRIADPKQEAEIVRLLEEYGRPWLPIAFDPQQYAALPLDSDWLPDAAYLQSARFRRLPRDFQERALLRLYRHKNNYVINNNGARNAALDDGSRRAKWILPWDGNCFLTAAAWQEIREAVTHRPWYPYAVVPMARVRDHDQLLRIIGSSAAPAAAEEPQIIFRGDAQLRFNADYYYGRRPKVELLWRLGVPGPWEHWYREPWDLPYPHYAPDAGAWQRAGWVARLPSGNRAAESGRGHAARRQNARAAAVTDFLRSCDAEAGSSGVPEARE